MYADGDLQTIRDDVRGLSPDTNFPVSNPSNPSTQQKPPTGEEECHRQDHPNGQPAVSDYENYCFPYFLIGAGYVAIAPYSVPRICLRDDSSAKGYFSQYPYQSVAGYIIKETKPVQPVVTADQMAGKKFAEAPQSEDLSIYPRTEKPPDAAAQDQNLVPGYMNILPMPFSKTWACQIQTDYIDNFDDLTGVSGKLIFETTSRWGCQASIHAFCEDLHDSKYDRLTLGDCNLIYRFAQHPRGQMRMGIGANWMTDPIQTDWGFNFTYGGDFFPCKPWVISAEIDWGTLGRAGLFRFRTTTGLIIRNFETYVGYEYSDIGTTQDNFFVTGLRIWF
ncbi:MAG: hypothetical protein ABSA26_12250 [Thermoguttaceae bacterium]